MSQVGHGFHHRLFGEVIQRTGGFVQNQRLRVVIERSGNADALAAGRWDSGTESGSG